MFQTKKNGKSHQVGFPVEQSRFMCMCAFQRIEKFRCPVLSLSVLLSCWSWSKAGGLKTTMLLLSPPSKVLWLQSCVAFYSFYFNEITMYFILIITKKIDINSSQHLLISPTKTFYSVYIDFNIDYDKCIQILLFT